MRFLSIILAMTLLGLSFVPCSDTLISVSDVHHDHTDHAGDSHEEACSPFCTCDCCSTFVENSEFELAIFESPKENVTAIDRKVNSSYTFDYSYDFNNGIWNPPRFII